MPVGCGCWPLGGVPMDKAHDTPKSQTFTANDLSVILGTSLRTIRTMDASGKLPKGLKLGRLRKWSRSDIEAWLQAGCPDRMTWERRRKRAI